jgi:hypothetical protein
MVAGLVGIKAAVNVALGPLFGLTRCVGRARGGRRAGAGPRPRCGREWAEAPALRERHRAGLSQVLMPTPPLSRIPPQRSESIRAGFMLAQGGEFAFVLLSLAEQLEVRGRGGALPPPMRPARLLG